MELNISYDSNMLRFFRCVTFKFILSRFFWAIYLLQSCSETNEGPLNTHTKTPMEYLCIFFSHSFFVYKDLFFVFIILIIKHIINICVESFLYQDNIAYSVFIGVLKHDKNTTLEIFSFIKNGHWIIILNYVKLFNW